MLRLRPLGHLAFDAGPIKLCLHLLNRFLLFSRQANELVTELEGGIHCEMGREQ